MEFNRVLCDHWVHENIMRNNHFSRVPNPKNMFNPACRVLVGACSPEYCRSCSREIHTVGVVWAGPAANAAERYVRKKYFIRVYRCPIRNIPACKILHIQPQHKALDLRGITAAAHAEIPGIAAR